MKYIITERQYRKIVKEQNENTGFDEVLKMVNDSTPKFIPNDEEYYGFDKKLFFDFKRRFGIFKEYLAKVIHNFNTDEYGFLGSLPKSQFVRNVIIYALLDFFYYELGMEFDMEDFMRNSEHEAFYYFLQNIYGKMIGDVYDELKQD